MTIQTAHTAALEAFGLMEKDRVDTLEKREVSRGFMAAAQRLPVLYNLASEFNLLLALLEDPEQDVEAIDAEMERVASDIKRKGHGVAAVIQALDGMATLQKAESHRLMAKARANEAHADRLRQYALVCMKELDIDRLDTGPYTLAVRLNNPKIEVVDESAIPDEFWRQPEPPPREVDKLAILAHWRATGGKSTPTGTTGGECVPGTAVARVERLAIT